MNDPINHPTHYTCHPSGVEPITITKHMNFCLGNVIKYVMRADYKGNRLDDLKKAQYYLNLEVSKVKTESCASDGAICNPRINIMTEEEEKATILKDIQDINCEYKRINDLAKIFEEETKAALKEKEEKQECKEYLKV